MAQHIVRPLIWNLAFLLFVLKVIAQESNKGEDFSPYMEEVRSWNKQMQNIQKDGIKTYKSILTPEGLAIQRKNLDDALSNTKTSLKPTVMSMRMGDAQFSLRIFRPKEIRAVILDIHGGAWYMGKATNDDWLNDQMARQCKAAVVSVDYGLAPEYPFPDCIRDCYAAVTWLLANARNQFGTDQIIISGASAGAHLSALAAIYIRDSLNAIDKIAGLNLMYGAYDLGKPPSVRNATNNQFPSKLDLDELYALVFSGWDTLRLRQPVYSPLFADLKGLPPALFTTGTIDPLVDNTYFMESKWREAGNKTRLEIYPECPHGFNALPTKIAQLANESMIKWINGMLH